MTQPPAQADLAAVLAPTGRLRAAINTGNAVLARREPDGSGAGVSVDLAGALATRLGVPLDTIVVDTAKDSVAHVAGGTADVGFFAIDPARSQGIEFTPPYVLIEGVYLVREDSPLQDGAEVDQPGRTVVVCTGSAYDLYLSRALTAATIVRVPLSQKLVEDYLAMGADADVAAGVKQQLEGDGARIGGVRLLPGRFMLIQQAMGTGLGPAARDGLAEFLDWAKSSGFVAEALARHGIEGVTVAP